MGFLLYLPLAVRRSGRRRRRARRGRRVSRRRSWLSGRRPVVCGSASRSVIAPEHKEQADNHGQRGNAANYPAHVARLVVQGMKRPVRAILIGHFAKLHWKLWLRDNVSVGLAFRRFIFEATQFLRNFTRSRLCRTRATDTPQVPSLLATAAPRGGPLNGFNASIGKVLILPDYWKRSHEECEIHGWRVTTADDHFDDVRGEQSES